MLAISTCPRCQHHVSLSAEMDRTARVRCPFCEAEYPLDEAIPPELIPVDNTSAEPFASVEDEDIVIEPSAEEYVQDREPENEAAAVVGQVPLGIATMRKRPTKAWWRAPLGYVTGGLSGCLVAYYALAFVFGPELKNKGFPILPYLPGITWMTTPPEKEDGVGEKPDAEEQTSGEGGQSHYSISPAT